jgi:hypothetical protein
MDITFEQLRLNVQSLLLGTDTLRASVLKSIKNGDAGGLKEKHFSFAISAMNKDVWTFSDQVVNTLCTVNHRKDAVRAIRCVEFAVRLLGNSISELPAPCITKVISIIDDVRAYWVDGKPDASAVTSGLSLSRQLSAFTAYAIAKASLLRTFPQITGCFRSSGNSSASASATTGNAGAGIKSPPITTTREITSCLSTCLNLMSTLLDAISALDSDSSASLRERQAFRCSLQALVKDLTSLLVLNTTYMTHLCRSADQNQGMGPTVSPAVLNALIGQFNHHHQKLRSLTLVVRGVPTLVLPALPASTGFVEKDLGVV